MWGQRAYAKSPKLLKKVKLREGRGGERRKKEGKGRSGRVELGPRNMRGARGKWPHQDSRETGKRKSVNLCWGPNFSTAFTLQSPRGLVPSGFPGIL